MTSQHYPRNQFSDGEIYRKIRLEASSKSEVDELRNLLKRNKRIALDQILKHKEFTAAFDDLLCFPGLWGGLELGNIQRHFASGCDEVTISTAPNGSLLIFLKEWKYNLHDDRNVWAKIMLRRPDIYQHVSIQDVELLQRRVPGLSKVDRDFVLHAFQRRLLFRDLTDPRIRTQVRNSLLKIRCLIPSIKSMHENMKYLEIGAKIIKKLILGKGLRQSIYLECYSSWKYAKSSALILDLEEKKRWNYVYQQMWMYALRLFADLDERCPLVEARGTKYRAGDTNLKAQYDFVRFVRDLGLRTEQIDQFLATDPMKETLRHSLSQIYGTPPQEQVLLELLKRLPQQEKPRAIDSPSTTYVSTDEDDLERRWGIPYQRTYDNGKLTFFLHNIAKQLHGQSNGILGPSFFQADFFRKFFELDSTVHLAAESEGGDDGYSDYSEADTHGDAYEDDADEEANEDKGDEDGADEDDDTDQPLSSDSDAQKVGKTGQGLHRGETEGTDSWDMSVSYVNGAPSSAVSDAAENLIQSPVQWSPLLVGSSRSTTRTPSAYANSISIHSESVNDYRSTIYSILGDRERSVITDREIGIDTDVEIPNSGARATSNYQNNLSSSPDSLFRAQEQGGLTRSADIGSSSRPSESPLPIVMRRDSGGKTLERVSDLTFPQEHRRSVISLPISTPTIPKDDQQMVVVNQSVQNWVDNNLEDEVLQIVSTRSVPRSPTFEQDPHQDIASSALTFFRDDETTSRVIETQRLSRLSLPSDPPRSEISLPLSQSNRSENNLAIGSPTTPIRGSDKISTTEQPDPEGRSSLLDSHAVISEISGRLPDASETEVVQGILPSIDSNETQFTLIQSSNHQRSVESEKLPMTTITSLATIPAPRPYGNAEQHSFTVAPFAVNRSDRETERVDMSNSTLLQFLVYVGGNFRLVEKYGVEMPSYLSNRRGWVMFVQKHRMFQSIPRHRTIEDMIKRPHELYCLVEESRKAWWQRSGVRRVKEHLRMEKAPKPPLRVRPRGPQQLIEYPAVFLSRDSVNESPHNKIESLPTKVAKYFHPQDSVQKCEAACSDCQYGLDKTQRCFLVYEPSGVRALNILNISSFPLSEETINRISMKYTCFFQNSTRMSRFDLKLLVDVTASFLVWLVANDEVEDFFSMRHRDASLPQVLDSSRVLQAEPPESGGHYDEAHLFQEETESDKEDASPIMDQVQSPPQRSSSRSAFIPKSPEEAASGTSPQKSSKNESERQGDEKGSSVKQVDNKANATESQATRSEEADLTEAQVSVDDNSSISPLDEPETATHSGSSGNKFNLKRARDTNETVKLRNEPRDEPRQKRRKVDGNFTNYLKRKLEVQDGVQLRHYEHKGRQVKRMKLSGEFEEDL